MTDDQLSFLPTASRLSHRVRRLALVLALVVALGGAAAYGFMYFNARPFTEQIAPAPFSALAKREEKNPNVAAMRQRIVEMEARLHLLENAPPQPSTANDERITQLEERIADMQRRMQESKNGLAAVIAFDQVKEAAISGEPYRTPLDRLRTAVPDEQEALMALGAHAEIGAPTLAMLQQSFLAAVPRALSPNPSTWDDVVHSLIRIRKVGRDQRGGSDEAIIARAEAVLQDGKVDAALKEIAALSPQAKETFAVWTEQAGAYVQIREALDALRVKLFLEKTS